MISLLGTPCSMGGKLPTDYKFRVGDIVSFYDQTERYLVAIISTKYISGYYKNGVVGLYNITEKKGGWCDGKVTCPTIYHGNADPTEHEISTSKEYLKLSGFI